MKEYIYETPLGEIHYWKNDWLEGRPTLILLPGLTADHRLFNPQIRHFVKNCNILTWDAPAHGKSRPFKLEFGIEDLAKYLNEILKRHGGENVILIGQSFGGHISQCFMSLYPLKAAGFISIDSTPLKREYFTAWELKLLKRTKWMFLSIPWNILKLWGANGTAQSKEGKEYMKELIGSFDRIEYCDLADYGYRLLAEAVESGNEYSVNCPAVLLCGQNDAAGSAKRYNKMWSKKEGYSLIMVPDSGHNANMDNPEKVNQIIRDFIDYLK